LLGASTTAHGVAVFRLSDLARVRTYNSNGYANAGAITPDGAFVAAGGNATIDDPDILVYNVATLLEARRFTLGPTSNALLAGGLAFSPDKSRLCAVTFPGEGNIAFRAIVSPTVKQKAISTSLPSRGRRCTTTSRSRSRRTSPAP
jgi:hypothetical protein